MPNWSSVYFAVTFKGAVAVPILPMLCGSCVYYLRKLPTSAVLLPALAEVKPTVMFTVPLIIEKIYFNKILPAFKEKWILNFLYRIIFLRKILNAAAGKKLLQTFGGKLKFFGIGGAKLNRAVEKFLIEAKFPYAIGYGLTETAPLLAGTNPQNIVIESLVVQQKGKLVALVHLNMEELEKKYKNLKQDMTRQFENKKEEILAELKEYVNSKVNKFSQINRVVLQPVPFQKTATLKNKEVFVYLIKVFYN